MEPLLLVGYGAVFVGLLLYVFHLRGRMRRLERKLEDVEAGSEE